MGSGFTQAELVVHIQLPRTLHIDCRRWVPSSPPACEERVGRRLLLDTKYSAVRSLSACAGCSFILWSHLLVHVLGLREGFTCLSLTRSCYP